MRSSWPAGAWALIAACVLPGGIVALAQRPAVQAQQLPPVQQQNPPFSTPQRPDQPAGTGQDGQNHAPSAPATAEQPNIWLPGQTAKLQALDKVNAQATALTIKVGQSATIGSLTIAVKACLIRPADQPADAAAFLDVTDSHPDAAGFKGWMLATEPSVSIMQHPIYDIRVTGCG